MNVHAALRAGQIAVDYNQSLQQMIDAGKYDWVDDDITTKRFPLVGKGVIQFETKVFYFDRRIFSKSVVAAIEANDQHTPWKPAAIEHLLAYGAKNPDEQRQYPIIGLGSVAEVFGSRDVPDLRRLGAERVLGLDWWGGDWGGGCRFLAVRPLSSAA